MMAVKRVALGATTMVLEIDGTLESRDSKASGTWAPGIGRKHP